MQIEPTMLNITIKSISFEIRIIRISRFCTAASWAKSQLKEFSSYASLIFRKGRETIF